MTVFIKSVTCPVSKCILIGLCSVNTVNREGFLFFCVLLGRSFLQTVKVLFSVFFCVHLMHTSLQTVYIVLLSTLDLRQCFTGQEWVKSVKFQFKLWILYSNKALSQAYARVAL